jgi:DNA-binding ferritin-like protein
MNCTICHKPITLNPSAAERARKFGGKPSDYTQLFTEHSTCTLAKREFETHQLMAKLRKA